MMTEPSKFYWDKYHIGSSEQVPIYEDIATSMKQGSVDRWGNLQSKGFKIRPNVKANLMVPTNINPDQVIDLISARHNSIGDDTPAGLYLEKLLIATNALIDSNPALRSVVGNIDLEQYITMDIHEVTVQRTLKGNAGQYQVCVPSESLVKESFISILVDEIERKVSRRGQPTKIELQPVFENGKGVSWVVAPIRYVCDISRSHDRGWRRLASFRNFHPQCMRSLPNQIRGHNIFVRNGKSFGHYVLTPLKINGSITHKLLKDIVKALVQGKRNIVLRGSIPVVAPSDHTDARTLYVKKGTQISEYDGYVIPCLANWKRPTATNLIDLWRL